MSSSLRKLAPLMIPFLVGSAYLAFHHVIRGVTLLAVAFLGLVPTVSGVNVFDILGRLATNFATLIFAVISWLAQMFIVVPIFLPKSNGTSVDLPVEAREMDSGRNILGVPAEVILTGFSEPCAKSSSSDCLDRGFNGSRILGRPRTGNIVEASEREW